jgi:hypothetical protein
MCVLPIYNDRNSVFQHCRHRAALSDNLPGRCSDAIINEGEKLTYSAGGLLTKRQKTEAPPVTLLHTPPKHLSFLTYPTN